MILKLSTISSSQLSCMTLKALVFVFEYALTPFARGRQTCRFARMSFQRGRLLYASLAELKVSDGKSRLSEHLVFELSEFSREVIAHACFMVVFLWVFYVFTI